MYDYSTCNKRRSDMFALLKASVKEGKGWRKVQRVAGCSQQKVEVELEPY